MLCLGREPTKTEHLEQKKFPQVLCLGREPTKTEHLRNFFSFDIVEIIILLVCVFLFL